jgi:hypothetical protein
MRPGFSFSVDLGSMSTHLPAIQAPFLGASRSFYADTNTARRRSMSTNDDKADKSRGVFSDKRQTFSGRVAALTVSLTEELGGEVTQTERSLISMAATLTARAEVLQAALLRGEEVDDDTIVRVNNAAARMLDKLGVKIHKRMKPKRSQWTRNQNEKTGKNCVVEYEPDTELRDSEQVPLQEPGGVEAFVRREVLPHAKDTWVDETKTQIGYEINFNRYFYKPQPLRSLGEIKKDILAIERETEGLLKEIVGASV